GLQGTANSYGLHFIGTQLAPALEREFGAGGIELHVFGAREPTHAVAAALKHPLIRVRGFVEDIDGEMLESPLFLLANNCGHYKAGHTRFLHAWSLHCCILAHSENLKTMPELEHDHNVLLAGSAEEWVAQIKRALADHALRERIGNAGRKTFEEKFAPRVVAAKLAQQMQEAIERIKVINAR
ncbi:MAG: glycosyltransferase, partial [Verrucomicrobia bacterium]|nr:glycosyltransferase [Verrucomicrobiota bacterium]